LDFHYKKYKKYYASVGLQPNGHYMGSLTFFSKISIKKIFTFDLETLTSA